MVETFVTTPDGVTLWTAGEGDGPLTVLLSNGGPGCGDYLRPVADLLAGPGRRIVRWEQRGTGRSGGDPAGPFTIEQTVVDMEAIRARYGVERWVAAGHSWGADLSLIYALAHPARCVALVALAGGRMHNDREWHAAYARGRDEGREAPLPVEPPVNLAVNRQLNDDWKRYVQRPTLFRELATLAVPALFLYGAEDIRPVWPVAQIAALMPDAALVVLPGADHHLFLTHGEQLRHAADAFLCRLLLTK